MDYHDARDCYDINPDNGNWRAQNYIKRWVGIGGDGASINKELKAADVPLHGTRSKPRMSILLHDGHVELTNAYIGHQWIYSK